MDSTSRSEQSELAEQRELQRIMRSYRKRTLVLIAAATLMYLAGFVVLMLTQAHNSLRIPMLGGLLVCLLLFATATIMLIHNYVNKPEIVTDKNLLSDGNEKQFYQDIAQKMKKMIGPLTSFMWLLTVLVFFFLSFATGKWYLTWLIFVLASGVQVMIKMFIDYVVYGQTKRLFGYTSSLLWIAVVIIYFLISFLLGIWNVSWMIFIVGALAQNVLRMVMMAREK